MIISHIVSKLKNDAAKTQYLTLPEIIQFNSKTLSGQNVTSESCKNLSTAYRCINILSDDVAKMPLQTFIKRQGGIIERMQPNNRIENLAWLLEYKPNRYMNPFLFKKLLIGWLITHGSAYAWQPKRMMGRPREIFVLRSDMTYPVFDLQSNLWYCTTFSDGTVEYLPDVEILHLVINSSDGISGKSVIGYARETLGRQMGAHETQNRFYGQGLNASGILWSAGELNSEARKVARKNIEEAMSGSENAYRLAILDSKFSKFEQITIKPADAQFIEGMAENDLEIANFFGMPLFKLNMGKQSYNSNEQANLDYLTTTLDPYLVQFEQEAMIKWLTTDEQNYSYIRFERNSLLRLDAETREKILKDQIFSGQLSLNEARQVNDLSAFPGGDLRVIPSNMAVISEDGTVTAISKPTQPDETKKEDYG